MQRVRNSSSPKAAISLSSTTGIEIYAARLFTNFTRSSMITNTALHRRSAPPFERGCSRQKFGTIRLPVKHLFFTTTSPWLSMTTSSRPFVKISPFFTSTTNSAGKSCKLDDIHQYDTFVPMVPVVQTKVTFDEAVDLILKALKPLGAEYLHTLGNGLRSRWVDRYETKGKRSGAFASSSYGNPPYVLMNYKAD